MRTIKGRLSILHTSTSVTVSAVYILVSELVLMRMPSTPITLPGYRSRLLVVFLTTNFLLRGPLSKFGCFSSLSCINHSLLAQTPSEESRSSRFCLPEYREWLRCRTIPSRDTWSARISNSSEGPSSCRTLAAGCNFHACGILASSRNSDGRDRHGPVE